MNINRKLRCFTMAQTPAEKAFDAGNVMIDYTPGTAVTAGDVVVQGALVGIALSDIAADTLGALDVSDGFDVPKDTSTFTVGLPVYWNATGNPVGGTVSTGAASTSSAGATLMGIAVAAAATGVGMVRTLLGSEY